MLDYFVELLSRMFKFKAMERIYIYSQLEEENIQNRAIVGIIFKIVKSLIRPTLKEYFKEFWDKSQMKKMDKGKKWLNINTEEFEIMKYCQKKDKNINRINSFLYESLDSKSYSLHPNSVDNDILHQMNNNSKPNKLNKHRNIKINKNFRGNLISHSEISNESNKSKKTDKIKINYINPPNKEKDKEKKEKNPNTKNKEVRTKNNLVLDTVKGLK